MAVIYAFVARGTDVVAEFTDFKGNFKKIAHSCLLNLPSNSNKFTTCKCDGHTFHYLREDGYGMYVFPLEFSMFFLLVGCVCLYAMKGCVCFFYVFHLNLLSSFFSFFFFLLQHTVLLPED
jgi:hypothetical protein